MLLKMVMLALRDYPQFNSWMPRNFRNIVYDSQIIFKIISEKTMQQTVIIDKVIRFNGLYLPLPTLLTPE